MFQMHISTVKGVSRLFLTQLYSIN